MTHTLKDRSHALNPALESPLGVEQMLSMDIDSLLSTAAAAILDDSAMRSTPETCDLTLQVELPPLVGMDDGWANQCVKGLSTQFQCEVALVELSRQGRIRKITQSDPRPRAQEFFLPIARAAVSSSIPIGSQHLSQGYVYSPILEQSAGDSLNKSLWSAALPLESLDGNLVVVCGWKIPPSKPALQSLHAFCTQGGRALSSHYAAWRFLDQGKRDWKRYLRVSHWFQRRGLVGVLGGAALVAVSLLPCPYRPKRDCVLEAASRHYVSSPMEGKLSKSLVRPGDEVKMGQVLAQMEDLTLRRELTASEAELQAAAKKRDIALANSSWSDLRLARLECQQIELKLETLRERIGQLEIQSPADGIVVQGDWHGNDGMPVAFGQSLFEVAPLDAMVVEIHLKPEDLPWVQTGARAILKTESTGARSWVGRIQRIEPRAEIINDQAVLVAEMEVENPEWLFRPGMKGEVVVDAGNHSVGWVLFHKPWRWLRNQWIW